MAVTYTKSEVESLMQSIADAYTSVGTYASDQWTDVVNALQNNWVGDDEQDFEKKLAERVCTLYENAYNLANGAVDTLAELFFSWTHFQAANTLDGSTAEATGNNELNMPNFTINNPVVEYREKTIADTDARGLVNDNSKTAIQETVTSYVTNIQNKTRDIFAEIDNSKAFVGESTSSIKTFIEACGTAIGELSTAVKDMYTALETLTDANYTQADTDVSEEFSTASSEVEKSLDELGESRWS